MTIFYGRKTKNAAIGWNIEVDNGDFQYIDNIEQNFRIKIYWEFQEDY